MLLLVGVVIWAPAQDRIKVDRSTPAWKIWDMDPKNVDPSGLPLTSVASLHSTGTPQDVDAASWRLAVSGPSVRTRLSLSYADLQRMRKVKKPIILICPETFYDYVEWEGVPLGALLEAAGAADYRRVIFTSVDGYSGSFSRQEVESHLIIVAMTANGVPLPRAHGFPARLVAEDITGSRWVKYLKEIGVE
jgi:DMSO/TMAO reductase YedYZ molybdopterin-dependent catalytic subunit